MRVGLGCAVLAAVAVVGCGVETASVEFVSISRATPRLGEATTVTFRALDSRGQPAPGVQVNFRLQTEVPGVTLRPTSVRTGRSDGVASTQVTATGRVSSVVVIAEVDGVPAASSQSITFAGAVPNGRQFTFQCGPIAGPASGGIHAIGAFDSTRHLIAGVKLECTAHVGDRNGDGVPGALVSFLTEAGAIAPSEQTIADVVGNATVLHKSSLPLPEPVDPGTFSWTPSNDASHTGEYLAPLWMHPFLWQANPLASPGGAPTLDEPRRADPIRVGVQNNPRDNLVTMIAVTTGEEGFDDVNGNGAYDDGEPFDDITEPFVDANDNGTWDENERWVDNNGNGVWDGKNGVYDPNTLLWAQERILWTGLPHPLDMSGPEAIFSMTPNTPLTVGHFGGAPVTFLVGDPWYNSIAQNADTDGCSSLSDEDNPIVIVNPRTFGGGIRPTYPPFTTYSFIVRDAHDPDETPPPSPFAPPVTFYAPVSCTFTSSPEEGHAATVVVTTVTGTVE